MTYRGRSWSIGVNRSTTEILLSRGLRPITVFKWHLHTVLVAGEGGIDTHWHTYPIGRVYSKWNRTYETATMTGQSYTNTRKTPPALVQFTISTCIMHYYDYLYKVELISSLWVYPWIFGSTTSVYIQINTKTPHTAQ